MISWEGPPFSDPPLGDGDFITSDADAEKRIQDGGDVQVPGGRRQVGPSLSPRFTILSFIRMLNV